MTTSTFYTYFQPGFNNKVFSHTSKAYTGRNSQKILWRKYGMRQGIFWLVVDVFEIFLINVDDYRAVNGLFHLFFKFSAKLLHGFFLASRWNSKSRKICLCIYRQLLFSHKFASCILCQFWQKTWLFCIKENNPVKGLFLTKIRCIHIFIISFTRKKCRYEYDT